MIWLNQAFLCVSGLWPGVASEPSCLGNNKKTNQYEIKNNVQCARRGLLRFDGQRVPRPGQNCLP